MAGYIGSKSSVTQVDGYTEAEADAEFVNDPNGAITVSGSNVGIGLSSNIASKLHVNSELSLGADNNNRMIVGSTSGGVGSIGTIEGGVTSFSSMTFKGGNIGIGTDNPNAPLTVIGGTNTAPSIQLKGGVYANDNASIYSLYSLKLKADSSESIAGRTITFDVGTTNAMRIGSTGAVTMPSQPAFMAHGNNGWQLSGGGSNITFGGVAFNNSGSYNSSTSRFTAPVAGKYMFITTLYQDNSYDCRLCMTINGAQLSSFGDIVPYGYTRGVATSGQTTLSIQYIANLNLNDYVEVKQRTGYGNARIYTPHSHFGGHLIG